MAEAFFSFEDAMGERKKNAESESEEEDVDGGDGGVVLLCPVLEKGVTAEMLVERVKVNAEQAKMVEGYEQGTIEWHLSRRGSQTRMIDGELYSIKAKDDPGFKFLPARLTASVFGTAVGHNKYSPPSDLIKDMLWSTVVSNEAMAYGNKMEPVACHIFETAMFFLSGGNIHIDHPGLMLACPGLKQTDGVYEGWAGTSPDGIIHWQSSASPSSATPSLLEIKCPSVNKRTFYSERHGNERFGIPHYYYDQIMGICGLNHLPDAYFVVYLPDRTQIQKYEFNPPYFDSLFKGMREFWFQEYLPAAIACAQGRLIVGHITPQELIAPHIHMDKDTFESTIHEANEHLKELLQTET